MGREGSGEIVRRLLENLDKNPEGKIVLKAILIFIFQKCCIKKNVVCKF